MFHKGTADFSIDISLYRLTSDNVGPIHKSHSYQFQHVEFICRTDAYGYKVASNLVISSQRNETIWEI